MERCRHRTLTLATALVAALALLAAPTAPAADQPGADTPLRPAGAVRSAPAAPAAATGSRGIARIAARATAACTGGLVYDDGEVDEAVRFEDDAGNGLPVDAVMRFDLPAGTQVLEQMCVCWNQENADAFVSDFEHDLVFFRADGPGGEPGTLITTIPFTVEDPPEPLETIFFEYDLTPDQIAITGSSFYAGVRWRSADAGQEGLVLCIDQDGSGNQPMWLRVPPPNPSAWVTPASVFAGSPVAPPTAFMMRVEALGEAPVETCPTTPCVEDATTLCLNDGRFRVEADWLTSQGTSGMAMAGNTLTDDTGYFWFFNDQNVEVVVKVLDGCGVNDRYWVFAGGLTNVQVEMRVCDTFEGIEETYFNALNTPFQPIQDTAAFATCP